jgi:hypothetical protein
MYSCAGDGRSESRRGEREGVSHLLRSIVEIDVRARHAASAFTSDYASDKTPIHSPASLATGLIRITSEVSYAD